MKKILIIVYYFPPAGGPGVQRWLKFTKYLPEFNIKPIIFKPKNASYPITDETLLDEISDDLEIIEFPIWEPYKFAEKFSSTNKKFKAGQFDTSKNQSFLSKLSIFIRGNFFIPDARKFWIKPSVRFLENYLKNENIDTIITSGPPHSLHLIGLDLKLKNQNLKWIADFRDPWTEISYHKELKLLSQAKNKHKILEKKVLSNANLVLATSFTDAQKFKKLGAKKSICITNGFDQNIFEKTKKTEKFIICYAGVLEQLRNPKKLWKILSELIHENSDFNQNFELKFVGKIDDKIIEELTILNLKNYIKNTGYLSHKESIKEMKDSDLLLICNFDNIESEGIIPGKLFDYLSTQNKIISIGPEKSDVKFILDETLAGKHFSYNDKNDIKNFILEQYINWKNNINPFFNKENILKYHRKNLTKYLKSIIDDELV